MLLDSTELLELSGTELLLCSTLEEGWDVVLLLTWSLVDVCDVVLLTPLVDVVTPLVDVVTPLVDVVTPLVDVVMPLVLEDFPLLVLPDPDEPDPMDVEPTDVEVDTTPEDELAPLTADVEEPVPPDEPTELAPLEVLEPLVVPGISPTGVGSSPPQPTSN